MKKIQIKTKKQPDSVWIRREYFAAQNRGEKPWTKTSQACFCPHLYPPYSPLTHTPPGEEILDGRNNQQLLFDVNIFKKRLEFLSYFHPQPVQ
jgi:hypothetical protein